ncbi:hypothetical protein L6164_014868 [Bauhinia variegata]|nr:hypothetical protein L6164_014868 [Bauhinia variegata]
MLALLNNPDQASLIFIIAVVPAMVTTCLMFIIRPVQGSKQARASDSSSFTFIYSICLILAAYLMGVLLVKNSMDLDPKINKIFALILITLVLLPVIIPILLVSFLEPKITDQETFLLDPPLQETMTDETQMEDEKPPRLEVLPLLEGAKETDNKIKHKECPHLGEDFTLMQALGNIDFWLILLSLVLSAGSGLTIINNMGQICQSLGDNNVNMYVSMLSISNFLGRVGGGYFSEKLCVPKTSCLGGGSGDYGGGILLYAMGLVGQLYVATILTGLGYGAQWSIAIAASSELFGLKNFGALYNFLTMGSPAGSLFLSGFVASTIYDYYAEQQAKHHMQTDHNAVLFCEGNICYSITCGILAGVCLFATVLSLIVVRRTKRVYAQFYAKSLT